MDSGVKSVYNYVVAAIGTGLNLSACNLFVYQLCGQGAPF